MIGWILLTAIIFGLAYIILKRLDKKQLEKLRREYDAEKDLSRRGNLIGVAELAKGELPVKRLSESGGREILPSASPVSPGKDSKRIRGILKKLKKK